MAARRRSSPRVALLVETTRTYTRELLAGVRRYVAAHGPWSCFVELRALESGPPPWLRNWDGDGILTRTFTQEMADVIAATGLPAVELRATYLKSDLPFVGMDNQLIGQMVAEHFFDRGYRNFAAYSLHTERFFEERVRNFVTAVEGRGGSCSLLPEPISDRAADWERGQARLMEWLAALPKPVGIFAANDQLGVRVLDACQRAGIPVPEEVAVVGAEHPRSPHEGGHRPDPQGGDSPRALPRGRTPPPRDRSHHRGHRGANRLCLQPLPAGRVQERLWPHAGGISQQGLNLSRPGVEVSVTKSPRIGAALPGDSSARRERRPCHIAPRGPLRAA
jgi:hypothetical protein